MITLEVSGLKYEGFTDIKIFRSIEAISGSFEFSATSNKVTSFPIKAGAPCRVFIKNTSVINGYVDSIDVTYDSTMHKITIRGRDRTADLVDSSIVEVKEFVGLGLIQIIRKVLDDHNLSAIKIINEAGADPAPFSESDPSSSPVSQSMFDFIETYARKRQVLLTTDGEGNIVLARSASFKSATQLQNIINGDFNNIKSATISYDFNKRFYKYTLWSGQNPSVDFSGGDTSYESVAVQSGTAIDNSINMRQSRTVEIISETSDSNVNLTDLATWTKNLTKARSTEYEAIVYGYHQDESETTLWKPNILVKVQDNFADINSTLLIKSVEYNLSLDTGSTTVIKLVDKDAYTLQLKVDAATQKSDKKGDDIIFTDS